MVETKQEVGKKASPKKVEAKIESESSVTRRKVTAKSSSKKFSNQNLIMSIVLGLFIIISAFQSFQINNLQTQIDDGGVKISSSSGSSYSSSGKGSGSSSVPSNIQELPQMVGGC